MTLTCECCGKSFERKNERSLLGRRACFSCDVEFFRMEGEKLSGLEPIPCKHMGVCNYPNHEAVLKAVKAQAKRTAAGMARRGQVKQS